MNTITSAVIVLLACSFDYGYAAKATMPPCCRNLIGDKACALLKAESTANFIKRCNEEPDFRIIQCCTLCEASSPANTYDIAAPALANAFCYDNMNDAYCKKFVEGTEVWTSGTWTCDGKHAAVAFRICRSSCGYCTSSVKNPATVAASAWTLANAQDAAQCSGFGK